jgi:hypothetical protein
MTTTSQAEQPMNPTILNYPGFQTLPRGIKQMLLVSESHFFNQDTSHYKKQTGANGKTSLSRNFKFRLTGLLLPGHRVLAPV